MLNTTTSQPLNLAYLGPSRLKLKEISPRHAKMTSSNPILLGKSFAISKPNSSPFSTHSCWTVSMTNLRRIGSALTAVESDTVRFSYHNLFLFSVSNKIERDIATLTAS